ncbi:MAG: hypothetical protein WBA97_34540 [Actinophytocola sp.]|uniref:hypothetical protein n=1 Tax=Actinophytocola sp. TaxID=1872138 RepID=UPI003C77BB1F
MAKLNTNVNVDGVWYGPDSDVPDAVAARISNPKVWDGAPPATPEPTKQGSDEVKEPPRGGPGSSADAWRTFMVAQNFEVPDNATAKDMQAAWDSREK